MNLGNDEFDCRFDAAASIGLPVKVGPLPLGCRVKSSGYWIILWRRSRALDHNVIAGVTPGIDAETENPATVNLREALIDEVTNVSIFKT
jgi:hypothetical protein